MLTVWGLDLTLRVGLAAASFEAPTPGVIALFGPSGAGKTTLLLGIAGLLRPPGARVELDNVALHTLPPEQRGIGYVFQEGRLFPHMSVAGNLRYGLRRAGPGRLAFDDVVALLALAPLLRRRPSTLSGGERQRTAIGRALLSQPRLLLMDEPLSALDQPRRDEILPYLARLRAWLRLPIVYASHSLDEVMRLADTLVMLEAGRVTASGPLAKSPPMCGSLWRRAKAPAGCWAAASPRTIPNGASAWSPAVPISSGCRSWRPSQARPSACWCRRAR